MTVEKNVATEFEFGNYWGMDLIEDSTCELSILTIACDSSSSCTTVPAHVLDTTPTTKITWTATTSGTYDL